MKLLPHFKYITASMALILLLNACNSNSRLQIPPYFEAYPDVITSTIHEERNQEQIDLLKALQSYNNSDFSQASIRFKQILSKNKIDQRIPFYLAISLVGEEKYPEAHTILTRLENNPGFPYMDGVNWNKALCLIALNENKKAIQELQFIVSSNKYKYQEAKELLTKLR